MRSRRGEGARRGWSWSWQRSRFCTARRWGGPEKVSFVSYPKRHRPLPTVLSLEEVGRLLMAVRHPTYQAIVMVLYGAGLRITEALALEVSDVGLSRDL